MQARANMQNTQAAAGREIVTKNHILVSGLLFLQLWSPHPRQTKMQTLYYLHYACTLCEQPKCKNGS